MYHQNFEWKEENRRKCTGKKYSKWNKTLKMKELFMTHTREMEDMKRLDEKKKKYLVLDNRKMKDECGLRLEVIKDWWDLEQTENKS